MQFLSDSFKRQTVGDKHIIYFFTSTLNCCEQHCYVKLFFLSVNMLLLTASYACSRIFI